MTSSTAPRFAFIGYGINDMILIDMQAPRLPSILILKPRRSSSIGDGLQRTLELFEIPWLAYSAHELRQLETASRTGKMQAHSILLAVSFGFKEAERAKKIWPTAPVILLTQTQANAQKSLHAFLKQEKRVRESSHPMALLALGEAGEINAALFAASMLAPRRPHIARKLRKYRKEQTAKSAAARLRE